MMDLQLLIFFAIVVVSIISFVKEWFPIEVTALIVLAALYITNLIDEHEAISGFANPAVITIGAMFILSHAFTKTGFIRAFTMWLEEIGQGSSWFMIILFLISVSLFSGFINNTATDAILIPVGLQIAKRLKMSPSKIMIPLSYASIVGGTCTLIGTSTNLIVNEIAQEHGLHFQIFELAKLGLIMVAITLAYTFVAQRWLLPSRVPLSGLTSKYHMATYLTEVKVSEDSSLIGKTFMDADVANRYDITVLEIIRDGHPITTNIRNLKFQLDDVILVQCPVENIIRFRDEQKVLLLTDIKMNDNELDDRENTLVEVMISPNSPLVGKTLKDIDFRKRYGVFVLAVRRLQELIRKKIAHVRFKKLDTLLVFGSRTRLAALATDSDFMVLDELDFSLHKIRYWWFAVLIIPAVVLLAAFNVLSIMGAALVGAIAVMALGIVPPPEAYKAINWTVIFLIAAFIPIEHAMESVELSTMIGNFFHGIRDSVGDRGLLAILFFLTMLVTSFLSNSATAIIMTPLAIETARLSGSNLEPFVLSVMFAASMAFMTPTGYQTNTMVFGPGGYRYSDFMRAGIPLQLMLGILAVIMIPIIWPI